MPKGGARPGAGRKRNSPNKASIKREEEVKASGVTPLDVMLKRMRYHAEKAEALLAEAPKEDKEKRAEAERHMSASEESAKAAAPYVHPKLSSVEMSGGLTVTHEDALGQLE